MRQARRKSSRLTVTPVLSPCLFQALRGSRMLRRPLPLSGRIYTTRQCGLMRLYCGALMLCMFLFYFCILPWPNIQAQPVVALSTGTARVGLDISIRGTGFLPTDTSCEFSSPSSTAVVTSSACVTQGGSLWGSFIVGNVVSGAYVIQASGNQGDSAQVILYVSGGAQVELSPAAGAPGVDVSIQGSGFLPTDTTCTISSPSSPNPILPGSGACVIQGGSTIAVGSFMIGNVLPGAYVVQVTGSQGDSAQALLEVR